MSLQLPLFELPSDWRPPPMGDLPSWEGAKRIGVDTETSDPHLTKLGPGVRRGGFIAGVSFSIEDGPTHYLPIRHEGGDNLPIDQVLSYLRDQAKSFGGILVGTNLNYDLDYLAEVGITFPQIERQRDVQIAAPLINELHDHYSLQAIAEREGLAGKDETLLREAALNFRVDPKAEMWRLPARYVGPYGERDASLPLDLLRRLERQIDEEDLWQIYDLESDLQPVLLKMRRRGVLIDQDKLGQIREQSIREEKQYLSEIKQKTGVEIPMNGIWTKSHLVKALRAVNVELPRTETGQPKADKEVLDGIDHPVAKLILQTRAVNKLRTTFVDSVVAHMTNGRLHCVFNQLRRTKEDGDDGGARYGRMSSEHPNLQQQLSRGPYAALWKTIYVPDPEYLFWASADYSQQEPRFLTHFAELCGLPKAKEAADAYRNDPSTDNHQMMADLCSIERKPAKEIYLGVCYGMGGAKVAHKLDLPTIWKTLRNGKTIEIAGKEAQGLLNRFDQRAPFVRMLAQIAEQQAKKTGRIVTILGRHCHFPKDANGEFDWTHKAISRLIQGSAADQTKRAVVDLDQAGLLLPLQVHDEVCGPIHNREEGEAIAEIMCNCVPLNVPSKVDLEIGPSWGEVS